MEEKDEIQFSLDDIMKEFGSDAGLEPDAALEELPELEELPGLEDLPNLVELLQEMPQPEPQPEPAEEAEDVKIFQPSQEPEVSGHTMRFDPIIGDTPPATGDDTIRLDIGALEHIMQEPVAPLIAGQTQVFTPIDTETLEQAAQQTQESKEGAEPFSADWEPKYDQPMGEYVPPEPIVFRPRSRLRELKKKMVAGPERRYYALLEDGLGKYQIAMFLNILVVILACGAVVLHQLDMVRPERMRLLVFSELFAMLLAALLGSDRLVAGLTGIFRGKFSLDSLLTLTFAACIADAMFGLQEVRVPFCAAFCLCMLVSLWAEFERRNTELGQMDTMRKATRLNRVAKAPGCMDGRPGFYVSDGEVEDFMETYDRPSAPERSMNIYAIVAALLATGIGVFAGVRGGTAAGVRIGAAALLAGMPATAFICLSRPGAILQRRLHRLGAVICGWSGMKAACGKNVILLDDNDLLPGGSVKVNGVKFYSQRDPEQTVAYTTALMEASGMGISGLFTQLLESRYGRHYEVEQFRYYDNGGIGGMVQGEPVLVGSLSFLQEMGVELPEGARVSQAVYAAVDGELCGVFAMAFGQLKGVSAALGTLCGGRKMTPVLITGNFLLSESFIRAKYGANTRRMAFPTQSERSKLAQWQPNPEASEIVALTTGDSLAGTAFAITGARTLRSAMNVGAWLHIIGGLIGMIVVLVLTLVEGGGALLTPANLLLLELIWAVPGLLVSEWTRNL